MRFIERNKTRKNAYRKAIAQWLKDRNTYNNGIIDKIIQYTIRRGKCRPVYIRSPKLKKEVKNNV